MFNFADKLIDVYLYFIYKHDIQELILYIKHQLKSSLNNIFDQMKYYITQQYILKNYFYSINYLEILIKINL